MTRKRNLKTYFLLGLRHLGMLCKVKPETKPRLRIARTVYPDNRLTPIEAEQHNWIEFKKKVRANCQFDSITRTCPCGIKSIEQFAVKCNKTRS